MPDIASKCRIDWSGCILSLLCSFFCIGFLPPVDLQSFMSIHFYFRPLDASARSAQDELMISLRIRNPFVLQIRGRDQGSCLCLSRRSSVVVVLLNTTFLQDNYALSIQNMSSLSALRFLWSSFAAALLCHVVSLSIYERIILISFAETSQKAAQKARLSFLISTCQKLAHATRLLMTPANFKAMLLSAILAIRS